MLNKLDTEGTYQHYKALSTHRQHHTECRKAQNIFFSTSVGNPFYAKVNLHIHSIIFQPYKVINLLGYAWWQYQANAPDASTGI